VACPFFHEKHAGSAIASYSASLVRKYHVALAKAGDAEEVADPVGGAGRGDDDVGPLARVSALAPAVRDRGPAVLGDALDPVVAVAEVEVSEDQRAGDGLAGVGRNDLCGGGFSWCFRALLRIWWAGCGR
jgi:hypothetical protein